MPDEHPPIDLNHASTGDPQEQEEAPPGDYIEANDRRTIRQAIMTQLLNEVATEIVNSKAKLGGPLRDLYNKDRLPLLRELITNPEGAFNRRRNKLLVGRPFGSLNLVVFRNAMAIGDPPVDPEEVALRVVIRSGMSGGYKDTDGKRIFRGCK